MSARGCAVTVMLAASVLACDRDAPRPLNSDLTLRMAGSWSVHFTVERIPVLAHRSAITQTLAGKFAFVPPSADLQTRTHAAAYGVYDVDFSSLGLPRRRELPAATMVAIPPDSVEIRLDPENQETSIVLRGELRRDSIAGTWNVSIPRVTEGGGRFVMARQRTP